MEKEPLLVFPAVFDSEMKLIVLDLLHLYKILELEQLVFLLDANKGEVLKNIWSMQRNYVVQRLDKQANHYFILTPLGYSAWKVKNKLGFWTQID